MKRKNNHWPIKGRTDNVFKVVEADEVKKPSPAKKLPILFDSGRADFNLDTENPNNIIQKTFQISAGLKMTCKLLAGAKMSSGKVIYPDWAPLIFQNKIKDNK